MASISIGAHVSPSHLFKKQKLLSPSPICLVHTHPSVHFSKCSFGSSPGGIRRSGLLGSSILARAEEKAKDSSSPPPSIQQQQETQPNSEKRVKDIVTPGSCDPLCSVDEVSSQEYEAAYRPKTDLVKALAIFAAAATGAAAINHSWVAANQDLAMAILFVVGYAGIIFEESLAFNKSGVGLLMAVSLWIVRSFGAPSTDIAVSELRNASAEVSEIVFFVLGAMTIVEIVDAHQGFKLVTDNITTRKPRTLLWVAI